jgi:hypothetical protein
VFADFCFCLCGLARARSEEDDKGEDDSIGIAETASRSHALSIGNIGPEGYG